MDRFRAWPPDHHLPDYQGPYPKLELENARHTLISCLLDRPHSYNFERLKTMIGIDSPLLGRGHVPPPPVSYFSPNISTSSSGRNTESLDYDFDKFKKELSPERSSIVRSGGIQSKSGGVNSQKQSLAQLEPQQKGRVIVKEVEHNSSSSPSSSHNSAVVYDSKLGSRSSPSHTFESTPLKHVQSRTVGGSTPKGDLSISSLDSGFAGENSIFDTPEPDMSKGNNKLLLHKDHLAQTPGNTKRKLDQTEEGSSMKKSRSVEEVSVPASYSVLKCDFCQFRSDDYATMESHLVNAKHFSGSLYNAIRTTKSNNLVSIEKMMAVVNKFSKTKALVVACPDCREVFEDIFMCAVHYKYMHGSVNGCYAVCPIIQHETVIFSVYPICLRCSTSFDRHLELHKHWKEVPDHHPMKRPTRPNVFVLSICPYCSKIFYNNFLACKSHVLNHQSSNPDKTTYAIETKHVMQPRQTLELPPFDTGNGKKDGLRMELTILKNMRQFYNRDVSGGKNKARALAEQISSLQTLIGAT